MAKKRTPARHKPVSPIGTPAKPTVNVPGQPNAEKSSDKFMRSALAQVRNENDALEAPAPEVLTPTQRSEMIYRWVFYRDRENCELDEFGVAVVAEGASVSLNAPELGRYLVLVWKAMSVVTKMPELNCLNLCDQAARILKESRPNYTESRLFEFATHALQIACDRGWMLRIAAFARHDDTVAPTAVGWEIIETFSKQRAKEQSVLSQPVERELPDEKAAWPWSSDIIPLPDLYKHLKRLLRIPDRTVRLWAMRHRWNEGVPPKDNKSKMVSKKKTLECLREKGLIKDNNPGDEK